MAVASTSADDEVIFVNETRNRDIARQRITAVVDLCSPESEIEVRNSYAPRTRASSVPKLPKASTSASTSNVSPPKNVEDSGIKCPVCLERLAQNQVHSTVCGHLYCKNCIQSAVKTCKKCPICNKKLAAKDIHRIYFS